MPAGVMAAPMIPGLNDAEMEKILEAAARAGARHAGYVLLRLPHEMRQMFEAWLHEHFPDRAKHMLNLIRQTRAGALEREPVSPPLHRPGRLRRPAGSPFRPRRSAMGAGRGAGRLGRDRVRAARPAKLAQRAAADVAILR